MRRTQFSFLSNLKIVDTGRQRLPKGGKVPSPEGMVLRILDNGKVYPGQQLVDRLNLEYKNKGIVDQGNGFDIVDSTMWPPTAHLPRVILLGLVPKTDKKVDLFAGYKHGKNGDPATSVLEQGAISRTLLVLVKDLGYLTPDQAYCDLQIMIDNPIRTERDIANVPKTYEKGDKKGTPTTARRENVVFYHAVPPDLLESDVEEENSVETEVQLTTQE